MESTETFRSDSINYSFSLVDPRTCGEFYLRMLVDCLYKSLSYENLGRLGNIKNRNSFGKPLTVKQRDCEVCLDYIQAVLEFDFLASNFSLDGMERIMEIGPGYGRTCHTIMSNIEIQDYFIIDLPKGLQLCRKYLAKVLNDREFSKIHFIETQDIHLIEKLNFDLCINVNGFGEMNLETLNYYFSLIDRCGRNFFTKNAVCNPLFADRSRTKHLWWSKVIDLVVGPNLRQTIWTKFIDVLSDPILPDVIDIFDRTIVEGKADEYIQVYQPGLKWECIGSSWGAPPSTHYLQAAYVRSD